MCFVLYVNSAEAFQDKFNIEQDQPVDVVANSLYYDKSTKTAFAVGDVEISQNHQTIYSDEAVYNRLTNTIYVKGNVAVRRPNGDLYFAEEMKFERNSTKGVAAKFSARMAKKSLIASNSAEMIDDNTIELEEMVFSPCKVCENNFRKLFPMWQFRASKATLDKKEETIYYHHARMEAFGVPFFYTPYMTSPSPGAKRKSGLLPPKYILNSSNLGRSLTIPYYLNIAQNMDATIKPTFTKFAGTLVEGEFRHIIKQGLYSIRAGVANAPKVTKQGALVPGGKAYRAYYDVEGKFKIKNAWHTADLSIKSRKIHDPTRTFLNKYKISSDQILNTDVSYTVYVNNHYGSLRGLQFQDLRPGNNNKLTPMALPIFDYQHKMPIKKIGAILVSEVNYTNLMRAQGASYNRLSIRESLKFPFILPYGNLFTATASVRADGYNASRKPIKVTAPEYLKLANNNSFGNDGRFMPEIKTEWSLPLIQKFAQSTVVVEPVITGIVSPNKGNLKKISNEDSEFPEIAAANLFTANRFVGYDRLESGTRANYGGRMNIKHTYFKNLSLLAGQNIRVQRDDNFHRLSGLDGRSSDYVSKAAFEYDEHISAIVNTRYSKNDVTIMRNETMLNLAYKTWTFNLGHYMLDKALITNQTRYKQEVVLSASYNLVDAWWLDGAFSSRLGKKVPQEPIRKTSDSIGLRYVGDCLLIQFGVQRDFTKLKDLKPETSYLITIDVPVF
ncbi:MAG: LPS-assembly protein LptD [Rickettsiales bacterium]